MKNIKNIILLVLCSSVNWENPWIYNALSYPDSENVPGRVVMEGGGDYIETNPCARWHASHKL